MRVFLTGHGTLPEHRRAYREALRELAPRHLATSCPAAADVILYTEHGSNKFRSWQRVLEGDAIIRDHPDKCFVYDWSDRPVPFMSGLYVNRLSRDMDWRRMRPADYWTAIEGSAEEELLDRTCEPVLLFSFRGKANSDVRKALLNMNLQGVNARVTETGRWRDYGDMRSDADRKVFLEEMRASWFVVCPRGLAPSTLRVYETMQLGRVPVILSDEWEPPRGVPWPDFSLRVRESNVHALPSILEGRRRDAREMGRLARHAWERWMRPGPTLLRRWLEAIEEIMELRPPDWREADQYRRWNSQRFQWENGIHPAQGVMWRAVRRSRSPTLARAFGSVARP